MPKASTLNGFAKPQWGMQTKHETAATRYQKAKAAGATIIRDDCPWAWAEGGSSRPASYNWSTVDAVFTNAVANGLKVIAQIGFAPQWANGGSTNDKQPPTSGNYQAFGDYARAFVLRCKSLYPGTLLAIEVWNEPNQGGFFVGHDETVYTALAQKVYQTVRGISPANTDADPSIEIWGGATVGVGDKVSWNDYLWLTNVLAAGVLNYVEGWSCHPYQWDTNMTGAQMTDETGGNGFSRVFGVSSVGGNLATRLAAAGYTGYIHGTEWGAPTNAYPSGTVPRGTSETNQADLFTLGWPKWIAHARAGHLVWYETRDGNSSDTSDPEQHFGAYHSDYTTKPVISRMAALPNDNTPGGGGGLGGGQTLTQWIQSLSGLIAFWKMGDAGSPLAPSQGSVSLAATGTGQTYAQAGLTGDPSEKAVVLNGSGWFQGGDNFDFTVKAPFTVGCLIKPSAIDSGSFHMIMTKLLGTGYQAWINNNAGTLRAALERDGDTLLQTAIASSPAGLAVATTALFIATYDGTNINVYVNNVKASASGTDTVSDNTHNFEVGGGGNGQGFKGSMSHGFLLNRALSDTEIAAGVTAVSVVPTGGGGGGGNAGAFVHELGHGNAVPTAGGTTFVMTLTAGATAGDLVVLCAGGKWTTATGIAVTDSKGNTWSVDVSDLSDGHSNSALIASTKQNVGTLVSGDTVTITISGGTWPGVVGLGWFIEEFSGIPATPLDKTASSNNASGTSGNTGTTATTVQANEIAICVFDVGSVETSLTLGSFTPFPGAPSLANGRSITAGYSILSASGAQSESASWSAVADFAIGLIATYKSNAGAGTGVGERWGTISM